MGRHQVVVVRRRRAGDREFFSAQHDLRLLEKSERVRSRLAFDRARATTERAR